MNYLIFVLAAYSVAFFLIILMFTLSYRKYVKTRKEFKARTAPADLES